MIRTLPARRTLAAAALAPLLVTGMAACGSNGSDAGGSNAKDSSSAVVAMADIKKGENVAPSEFVQTISDGVKASTTAHMTMKVDVGQMGNLTGQGDVDYQTTPPEMAMTMTIPMGGKQTQADIRLVDGIVYVSMGDLSGGKFIKLDPSAQNGPMGDMSGMLDQMDPMAALKKLEPSIQKVTYVGPEDVSGQSLHHYEMTIDTAKMMSEMKAPSEASKQVPKSLTFDIWLDGQDRLSKLTMDVPVAGTESKVELTATDWGKKVSIQAPPASQVTQMPDGMGSGMMGSSA